MNETEPLTPLSLAILVALAPGPRHGYALMQEIGRETGRRPGTGTLYAALDRLESEGRISERPAAPGDDPRRRYYAITAAGVAAARVEAARLLRVLDRAQAAALFPSFSALREGS